VKRGPCDYQFENIRVSGRIYRVPVIDNTQVGKVIENLVPVQKSTSNQDTAAGKDRREERGKKMNYTHFLSIPIDSP
jgi:hypothetical protein